MFRLTNDFDDMAQQAKIYVAGHRGMVGSAIVRQLRGRGQHCHGDLGKLDLINQAAVKFFFQQQNPAQIYFALVNLPEIKL